jgi:hypothetical protein
MVLPTIHLLTDSDRTKPSALKANPDLYHGEFGKDPDNIY